jgi:hypothetical protein
MTVNQIAASVGVVTLMASVPALAHPGHVEDVAAGFVAGLLLGGAAMVAAVAALIRRRKTGGARRVR